MNSQGKIVNVNLSVNKLCANGVPFIAFLFFCKVHGYIEHIPEDNPWYGMNNNNHDITIDFVELEPSEDMEKNVQVWEMFDKLDIIWDDGIHYPCDQDYKWYLNHLREIEEEYGNEKERDDYL